VLKRLGDFPVDPHFIPNYNPWEQRFIAPNGDFFRAIRKGKASVVTDHIDRFQQMDFIKIGETSRRYHHHGNRT
jgi:cation diffusion facilitator CzcD-associated flavoprotein CzcO